MTTTILLGAVLGLFSGLVPGPFSALVAGTALEGGFWAGFRLAVLPIVTESTVMAAAAFSLTRVPEGALRWVGVAGALLVFYMAHRTWAASRGPERDGAPDGKGRLTAGLALAVLSPAPWVFWLLVGAPILLDAWHQGWVHAAAFLGSFLVSLCGVHVSVAAVAAYGHKRLPDRWRRRMLTAVSVLLVGFGGVLLWQSWAGNFERLVRGSEQVESVVRGAAPSSN